MDVLWKASIFRPPRTKQLHTLCFHSSYWIYHLNTYWKWLLFQKLTSFFLSIFFLQQEDLEHQAKRGSLKFTCSPYQSAALRLKDISKAEKWNTEDLSFICSSKKLHYKDRSIQIHVLNVASVRVWTGFHISNETILMKHTNACLTSHSSNSVATLEGRLFSLF